MKRKTLIIGASVLTAVLVAGGATWGLVASGVLTGGLSPVDTSKLVYTGGDLAGFLISSDAAKAVSGAQIEMGAPSNTLLYPYALADPVDCEKVAGSLTSSPAGYRVVGGGLLAGSGPTAIATNLTQASYQFPSIDSASIAFEQLEATWESCSQFSETFGFDYGVPTSNDAQLTMVKLADKSVDAIGAVVVYSGGQQKSLAVVAQLTNNVISVGQLIVTGKDGASSIDDNSVHKLANEMLRQSKLASEAKATGRSIPVSKQKPWVIGFGSIGPFTIDMTAQQVSDALGNNGPLYVDPGMDFCGTFYLGRHNDAEISGLAETDGASGHLDSLSTFSSAGTEHLDVEDLPPFRPKTSEGISVGSSLSELKAAYSGNLKLRPHTYIEGGYYGYAYGPSDTVIMFNIDADGVVFGITTGRVPQAQYIEGCA